MKHISPTMALSVLAIGSPLFAQTHHHPTDSQIETQVQQAITSEHAFRGSTIMSSVNTYLVNLSIFFRVVVTGRWQSVLALRHGET